MTPFLLGRLAGAAVLLCIGACSTAPLTKPIGDFADATTAVVSARSAMLDGERADQIRATLVAAYLDAPHFAPSRACSRGDTFPGVCLLTVASQPRPAVRHLAPPRKLLTEKQTASYVSPAPPKSPISPGRNTEDACVGADDPTEGREVTTAAVQATVTEAELFDELGKYADALKAVSNAADGQAFDAASDKLAKSVGTVVGTVGVIAAGVGAAAGPTATAVVRIGEQVAHSILEQRRYDRLRQSLVRACKPIRVLSIAAGEYIASHQALRLEANSRTITRGASNDVADPQVRVELLKLAWDAAAAQDSLRRDPRLVAMAMRAAHDRLVLDIRHGTGNGDAFFDEGAVFADEASALRDALKRSSGSAH